MTFTDGNPYHFKNHRTAWARGRDAFRGGYPITACPYSVTGSRGYMRAWEKGWRDASNEANPYHFKNHRTAWNQGFAAYLRGVKPIGNPYLRVWVHYKRKVKVPHSTNYFIRETGYSRAWHRGWLYAEKYYTLATQGHTAARNKRGVRGGV